GRETPEWFRDAKLGIFIHWGLFSVPGWAPPSKSFDGHDLPDWDWREWFANNAYAEWYENSLNIEGSPTSVYHQEHYGDAPYSAFAADFAEAVKGWDPAPWAALFKRIGARYVVPTTKHHDGYCLWPTSVENPNTPNWHSERDLIGELAVAVRAEGMRFGTYYSGGLDWSWRPGAIMSEDEVRSTFRQDEAFIAYIDAQWRELIDRYQTDVLWNDIGAPAGQDVHALFTEFFAKVPDGVVDNRFGQRDGNGGVTAVPPYDYSTPEYQTESSISAIPFEACRGIGHSFGYNRRETDAEFIGIEELIHYFADLVSKNGNLLLNVGPMANGVIQEEQIARLEALGAWLDINGDAIYASRPWKTSEGTTFNGEPVRFTTKGDTLYAIVLTTAVSGENGIEGVTIPEGGSARVLGATSAVSFQNTDRGVAFTLAGDLPAGPAFTVEISAT
ncbi:MAG: alpha-L-fucosidase, partial [Thermomicrobiales bacterium]